MSPRVAMLGYDRRLQATRAEIKELQARLERLQGARTGLHNLRADATSWNPMFEVLRLFCLGHERPETRALLDALFCGGDMDATSVIDSCESHEEAAAFCQMWTRFQVVELTIDVTAAIRAGGLAGTPQDKVRESLGCGRLFDREMLVVWQTVDVQRYA